MKMVELRYQFYFLSLVIALSDCPECRVHPPPFAHYSAGERKKFSCFYGNIANHNTELFAFVIAQLPPCMAALFMKETFAITPTAWLQVQSCMTPFHLY